MTILELFSAEQKNRKSWEENKDLHRSNKGKNEGCCVVSDQCSKEVMNEKKLKACEWHFLRMAFIDVRGCSCGIVMSGDSIGRILLKEFLAFHKIEITLQGSPGFIGILEDGSKICGDCGEEI